MRVQSDRVVFAYSGATFVSGGNTYVQDFGPHSFHMRFGAAGAAPVPQLDGSLLFSGAQYAYFDGDLARYYSKMPTGECTWLTMQYHATAGSVAFACDNNGAGGTWKGLILQESPAISELYALQGTAALPRMVIGSVAAVIGLQPTIAFTYETTPRALLDQSARTPAWGAGAFGTVVYDAAQIPRIGMRPNAANPYIGRISYLALIRGAVSSSDMAELSAMMGNATSGTCPWPFCVR